MAFTLTKQGNTLGFTRDGLQVLGKYRKGARAWAIWLVNPDFLPGSELPVPESMRYYPDQAQAIAYAESIIDGEATARLAWW